jgi:tRNA(adenine34) deaminase
MKNPDEISNSFNSLPAESAFDPSCASRYMNMALQEAIAGAEEDEVPVGAVIEYQGKIIGRAHNQRELLSDPTAHAEMIALTQAAAYLETWRLIGCTMYVTLEPCPMCAGALVLSRLDRLVYGPADPKAGACESLYNIVQDERLNHRIEVVSGFMAEPCRQVLQEFFARKRRKTKDNL